MRIKGRKLDSRYLLTEQQDTEMQSLEFSSIDLEARLLLLEMCLHQPVTGDLEGAVILFHASLYLKDRKAYEADPPPSRHTILDKVLGRPRWR